ncbi:MAG: thiopurine S-methyltransferase [Shimia sp.]|uniref:thiopurine S-methyltransferase n=1 Tax=Shimia sp. TaxID=1954381 RepID=UPI003B8BB7AC
MEEAFWQDRWQNQKIGFHESAPNARLIAHFQALAVPKGAAVFVPLCGKSLDIDWLLAQGHPVIGIEFHEAAVQEVFERLGRGAEVTQIGDLRRYVAGDLTLFCGDFFALTAAQVPEVAAVFDRAALVAIAPERRQAYVDHVKHLCPQVPTLLVSFDYDQSQMQGPPFSVPADMVDQFYGDDVTRKLLQSDPITSPPKICGLGTENVYLLAPVK